MIFKALVAFVLAYIVLGLMFAVLWVLNAELDGEEWDAEMFLGAVVAWLPYIVYSLRTDDDDDEEEQ